MLAQSWSRSSLRLSLHARDSIQGIVSHGYLVQHMPHAGSVRAPRIGVMCCTQRIELIQGMDFMGAHARPAMCTGSVHQTSLWAQYSLQAGLVLLIQPVGLDELDAPQCRIFQKACLHEVDLVNHIADVDKG